MKTIDGLNDIRLVALDLDGTLLNSAGEVSEENKRALKFLQDSGVQIAIASGRILPYAHQAAEKVGLGLGEAVNIGCGGGIVFKEDEVLYKLATIDNDAYKKTVKAAKEDGYDVIVTDGKSVYYDTPNVFSEEYITKILPDKPQLVKKVDNLEDLKDMVKIMFHFHSPAEFDRAKSYEKYGVDVVKGGPDLIEIGNPKLSKWSGLEKIMEVDGLKPENVLAIGDSGNDGPMLYHSGIGVAMKNALPDIMDQCDILNDFDNDEDGVAEIIWTLFAPEQSKKEMTRF